MTSVTTLQSVHRQAQYPLADAIETYVLRGFIEEACGERASWRANCRAERELEAGGLTLVIGAGVTPELLLQDFLSKLSLEDLEAMQAILQKYSPAELGVSRELRAG